MPTSKRFLIHPYPERGVSMRTWANAISAHHFIVVAVGLFCGLVVSAVAQRRRVTGVEALRVLTQRKQFAQVEQNAYQVLWSDIYQPEALGLLAQALEAQKKPEEAAVCYTLMLRATAESELPKAEAAKYQALGEQRLKVLNKTWNAKKAAYETAAASRKFADPTKVDDGWMTNVVADLKSLHGLYASKLIGGRKDKPADWVHNAHGELHRAGFKFVTELDGRQGVAFTCFNPKLEPTAKRPMVNRIAVKNLAGKRYLRVGTKGYNFPFGMTVTNGQQQVHTQTVDSKQWSDLKIDLGPSPMRGEQITIELFLPEKQKIFEGSWFDYIDFFDE